MKTTENKTFDGTLVDNAYTGTHAFRNCTFLNLRERKRGLEYKNIVLKDCYAGWGGLGATDKTTRTLTKWKIDGFEKGVLILDNTVFRQCDFANLRGEGLVFGCVFDRSIFRQIVRSLRFVVPLAPFHNSMRTKVQRAEFAKMVKNWAKEIGWVKAQYKNVDWAIDIREAVFEDGVVLESVPGEKVIRSPENSIVWSNELVSQLDPSKAGIKTGNLRASMDSAKRTEDYFLAGGDYCHTIWQYQCVVNSGTTTSERKTMEKDFDRLCKLGVAHRETPKGWVET